MKFTNRFLLAVTLFGAPGLFAAGGGQATAYEQAVTAYIDGATEQMRAIRTEVDVATARAGDAGKRAYAEVYRGLDQCDAMVTQLRVSGPKDFDLIKARFETTRAQMVVALGNVRKSPPPDLPSAPN